MMQDLIEKVETVQDDCQPEIYKDYKELKQNISEQKDENQQLKKLLETVARETADQRERVELCSERILVMEEQVGMMAHNEAYKKSIEVPDELYQDSMRPQTNQALQMNEVFQDKEIEKQYQNLNPASTTSSLEQAEREALIQEQS